MTIYLQSDIYGSQHPTLVADYSVNILVGDKPCTRAHPTPFHGREDGTQGLAALPSHSSAQLGKWGCVRAWGCCFLTLFV